MGVQVPTATLHVFDRSKKRTGEQTLADRLSIASNYLGLTYFTG